MLIRHTAGPGGCDENQGSYRCAVASLREILSDLTVTIHSNNI